MTTITPLPPAPDRGDPSTFAAKADPFVSALPTMVTETNTVIGEINTAASNASTSADTATTKASEALTHANNSASSAELAEDWATSLTEVSGGLYGARKYAQIAEAAVATLPDGVINDATISPTDTWSSLEISDRLSTVLAVGYETRSANVALSRSDNAKLIDVTGGNWVQTLDAAATLGAGWYCYLRYANGGLPDAWNGGFSSDTLWTKGAGWTISAGKANASSSSSDLTSTASPLAVGRRYRFTVTVTRTAGTLYLYAGTAVKSFSTAGTHVVEMICAANTTLKFTGVGGFSGTVDDLKIEDLGGITVDPSGSELIDGVTVGQLRVGQSIFVICTGSEFVCQAVHTNTITEFIGSGTSWVCPLGVRSAEVTLVSGGQGGSGSSPGIGGSTLVLTMPLHPSIAYTYTIGAGGVYPNGIGGATSIIAGSATVASTSNPYHGVGAFSDSFNWSTSNGWIPSWGAGYIFGRSGTNTVMGGAGGIILRY